MVKYYSGNHYILLVGEGDFSFSLCLARSFGSASKIVATSLDSRDEVQKKYKKALSNVDDLEKLGALVIHGVDATKMKCYTFSKKWRFDRIIFNFPHAGFLGKEDNLFVINKHKNLVDGFFMNAKHMLRPNGEIHVNHKTTTPFCDWKIEDLANKNDLIRIGVADFKKEDFPGYNNKRGDGTRSDDPFRLGECSTFMFALCDLAFNMGCLTEQINVSPIHHHSHIHNFTEVYGRAYSGSVDGGSSWQPYPVGRTGKTEMSAQQGKEVSMLKEKVSKKVERHPTENYGRLIQSSPSRQNESLKNPPPSSSSSSSLQNLPLQNRCSPLTRSFNQAVSYIPPSPLLKTPEKSIDSSPDLAQSSPSSTSPSPKDLFTVKSITLPIIEVEPEFAHPNTPPRKIASQIFPLNMFFFPESPGKTRKWYEAILVATKSIEITPLGRNSTKLTNPVDDQVAFSMFKILKVLTVTDWNKHIRIPNYSSIHIVPPTYTYSDYKAAWYNFLYLRPGETHSWFVWFRKSVDKFPSWFIEWFYFFGLNLDLLPPFANKAFVTFRHNTNFPSGTRLLNFVIKFGVPWIFHWDFCFAENLPYSHPKYLARSVLLKWWEKFKPSLLSLEKITLGLQKQFLLFKSQVLADLSKAKTPEEFQTALKALSSATWNCYQLDEDEDKDDYVDHFSQLYNSVAQPPLFGHESDTVKICLGFSRKPEDSHSQTKESRNFIKRKDALLKVGRVEY